MAALTVVMKAVRAAMVMKAMRPDGQFGVALLCKGVSKKRGRFPSLCMLTHPKTT